MKALALFGVALLVVLASLLAGAVAGRRIHVYRVTDGRDFVVPLPAGAREPGGGSAR